MLAARPPVEVLALLLLLAAAVGTTVATSSCLTTPTPICVYNGTEKPYKFYVKNIIPSQRRIGYLQAFRPEPGKLAWTGNCDFVVDSDCNVVQSFPCSKKTGNPCTRWGSCAWPGNPATCATNDTSCMFEGGHCVETNRVDGVRCPMTLPINPYWGIDDACFYPGGQCIGGECQPRSKPDGARCWGYVCNATTLCCPTCNSGQCINVGHGAGLCCQECTGKRCPPSVNGTKGSCVTEDDTALCACTAKGFCEATATPDSCFGKK
eukprot:SM000041S15546  [mRNA]  locus=s41:752300:753655:+ [translate_table: standard]